MIYLLFMRKLSLILLILGLIFLSSASQDLELIKNLTLYSGITYQITKTSKWDCSFCDSVPLVNRQRVKNDKFNLFGYTGYSEDMGAIIVALRGVVFNLKNFKSVFGYSQKDYRKASNAKVHQGFYQASKEIIPEVLDNLKTLRSKYPSAKIYITGHSMGAALAVLVADEVKDLYGVTGVYTFGEPRIGNKKFASYINDRFDVVRVINDKDPVPAHPTQKSIIKTIVDAVKSVSKSIKNAKKKAKKAVKKAKKAFHLQAMPMHEASTVNVQYYHEGIEVWIRDDKKTVYTCGHEDKKCYNKVTLVNLNYQDHLMVNYLKGISKAIDNKWSQKKE